MGHILIATSRTIFLQNLPAFRCLGTTCHKLSQDPNIKEQIFDTSFRPTVHLEPEIKQILQESPDDSWPFVRKRTISPPEEVTKTINLMFKKEGQVGYSLEQCLAAGLKLRNFLINRKPPMEFATRKVFTNQAKSKLEKQYESELLQCSEDSDALEEIYHKIETKTERSVQRKAMMWKPINFDKEASYAYLLAKSPYDYACARKVLQEIKNREPEFQPRTFFDYGSGVGAAIWAAKDIFGVFNEIFAVDTSPDMNDLAKYILLKGKSSHSLPAGTFFRMHMPASHDLTYDLVTSSFTLLELPNAKARLTVIDNLWRKTNNFLVLIEDGSNTGFQVLAEARDYLNQISRMEFANATKTEEVRGHIFAPCPHAQECPRFFNDFKPCNFDVKYKVFQCDKIPNEVKAVPITERFTYLIFKKGERSDTLHYPRLIGEPFRRKNHIICRMCTDRGKLEEYVSTKSNSGPDSKQIYRYVKQCQSGDQLKVQLEDVNPSEKNWRWSKKKHLNQTIEE